MEEIELIVDELGGVPGFERQPAQFLAWADAFEIVFRKDLGEDSSAFVKMGWDGTEMAQIPQSLLRRYVKAKLDGVCVIAEALLFNEVPEEQEADA